MSLEQPDPEVLRRAQRGDERAFAQILRAYETTIFNYVYRIVGDRALAEDLTQEVFVRLFQVTKNRVLDELRARERRPQSVIGIEDAPRLEIVDPPVERLETIDAVWRAVRELNPDLKM